MRYLVWVIAVFHSIILACPASAASLVNFTYSGEFAGFPATFASGTLTVTEGGNELTILSATGDVLGSQITGVSGIVGFRDFIDFTTTTGKPILRGTEHKRR
jgi:hypothetical protein